MPQSSPARSQTLELGAAAALESAAVLERLGSSAAGLSREEAATRLATFGPNALRSHGARPLEVLLRQHGTAVGAVILTVTNNSGGGQPVSLENAAAVSAACRRHGIPFLLDCCRIAENSWFIKHREPGMQDLTYREIAQRMFALADGAVMSAKKDGLANMGGFLALRDEALAQACTNLLIITEGFTTYGGLSGRDLEAIAIGLEEVFDPHYLEYRVRSTTFLGEHLHALGIPLMNPLNLTKGLDNNRGAWIEDPDGNRIELMEMAPDCVQYDAMKAFNAGKGMTSLVRPLPKN